MNEIDIALLGAKMAASKNESASVAVHGVSVAYNIAQIARYSYAYSNGQRLFIEGLAVDNVQMEQIRQERIKHTVLAALDITSLFLLGLSGLQHNR